MTDRPSDRAIAQAFYEQYQESLRAAIDAARAAEGDGNGD